MKLSIVIFKILKKCFLTPRVDRLVQIVAGVLGVLDQLVDFCLEGGVPGIGILF